MKYFFTIYICLISFALQPMVGFGQRVKVCTGLVEPLFLQGPDSICAGKKELVIKTSRLKIAGAKYLWRTPLKDKDSLLTTTDSMLRIPNPSLAYSGVYFVATLMNDTCRSEFFGPVSVQVVGAPTVTGNANPLVIACRSSESTLSSTLKLSGMNTGKWRGSEGLVFEPDNAPNTVVKGLKPGTNTAFWSLNVGICPDIMDTFTIRHEVTPVIQMDGISLRVGEASSTIHLGHVNGSNLDLLKDIKTIITQQPRNGDLQLLSDNIRLKYTRKGNFRGTDGFKIQICNTNCKNPDLCSPPVPFEVKLDFDERYPNVTIPELLTPQRAGETQFFVIENIEKYDGTELTIFDRWGNTIQKMTDYKNDFQGITSKGVLTGGAYYYRFQVQRDKANPDGKPLRPLTGIFYILN